MREIEHAVAHETVFHQFMLYTPMPGTPLHREVAAEGRMLTDVDWPTSTASSSSTSSTRRSRATSRRRCSTARSGATSSANGPSLYRLMASMMTSWRRYRDDADARVRERVRGEAKRLASGYGAALWAMEKYFKDSNRVMSQRVRALRLEIEREIGGWSPWIHRIAGPFLAWSAKRDARRAPRGKVMEPQTFVDRSNWVAS